jgi:hypothetical protein
VTTTTPLKPPLAAGTPKPQQKQPDNAAPKKPIEPDAALFARSIAQRQQIEVTLHDGTVIKGHVTTYGQYTISIVMDTDIPIVIFKNFIATARAGDPR